MGNVLGNVLWVLGNVWGDVKRTLGLQSREMILGSSSSDTNRESDNELRNIFAGNKLNASVWELRQPTKPLRVDVIFFHGLQLSVDDLEQAHWRTWLSRSEKVQSEKVRSAFSPVLWPRDWLGESIPESRIWSISYNSVAQTSAQMTLKQITENMIQDIITARRHDHPEGLGGAGQNCPVILVGHSLGGLIIKSLILECLQRETDLKLQTKTHQDDDQLHRITTFLDNCKGVFFYSSPFGGSKLADLLSLVPNSDTPLVRLLKVFDSEMNVINERFQKIRRGERLKISSSHVYESLDTTYKSFSSRVVEEGSARRDVDSFYSAFTNHIDVCKAQNRTDNIYTMLEDFIKDNAGLRPPR